MIPIYNGEKYLKECIDSVLKQTYPYCEIILVDDGSTDYSLDICYEYDKKDQRIKVISQENKGVTAARKLGVHAATGEYVYFVDCDDWLDENAIEILVKEAINCEADIVVSGFFYEKENDISEVTYGSLKAGIYDAEHKEELYAKMFYSNVVEGWGIWPTLWAKLFSKKIIEESLEKVDERIFYGEDAACVVTACFQADKIVVNKNAAYHYRLYSIISVSRKRNKNLLDNLFYIHEYLYDLFSTQENKTILLEQLKYYMVNLMNHAGKLLFDIPYHLCQSEWMRKEVETWMERYNDLLAKKKYMEIRWMFPFYELNDAKKIVLYGAGGVGRAYFNQIKDNPELEVVAWIDQCVDKEKNIIGIQDIIRYEYDCIVIAILNEELIDNIIQELVAIGVEKEKIIWKKPIRMMNYYIS